MNRSSKIVSLALIGSAVVLGGYCCYRYQEDNQDQNPNTPSHGHGGGYVFSRRSPGGYVVTNSGGGRPGGGVSTGVTRTGGFGSIGHSAAGS